MHCQNSTRPVMRSGAPGLKSQLRGARNPPRQQGRVAVQQPDSAPSTSASTAAAPNWHRLRDCREWQASRIRRFDAIVAHLHGRIPSRRAAPEPDSCVRHSPVWPVAAGVRPDPGPAVAPRTVARVEGDAAERRLRDPPPAAADRLPSACGGSCCAPPLCSSPTLLPTPRQVVADSSAPRRPGCPACPPAAVPPTAPDLTCWRYPCRLVCATGLP